MYSGGGTGGMMSRSTLGAPVRVASIVRQSSGPVHIVDQEDHRHKPQEHPPAIGTPSPGTSPCSRHGKSLRSA